MLDRLAEHLEGVVEVHRGQPLQRLLIETGTNPTQLSHHPAFAGAFSIANQQTMPPLPLHLGPNHFDRVEDGSGRRQEEQLALEIGEELLDFAAQMSSVVVQHYHGAAEVVLLRHLLEEQVDGVLVRGRRQPGEELAVAEGADNGDVVLVLLAELDPDASSRLPYTPWSLP